MVQNKFPFEILSSECMFCHTQGTISLPIFRSISLSVGLLVTSQIISVSTHIVPRCIFSPKEITINIRWVGGKITNNQVKFGWSSYFQHRAMFQNPMLAKLTWAVKSLLFKCRHKRMSKAMDDMSSCDSPVINLLQAPQIK